LTQKMGKESKEHASSQDVIIDLESTRNHDNEGSSGKKRKKSRYFDSFDSLNSSSSVKQGGDNGFYVDGDFDSSQGSGNCSDNVMAALDGANQRKAKRRKSPPQSEILSNFNLIRDPKKKDVGNRKMCEWYQSVMIFLFVVVIVLILALPTSSIIFSCQVSSQASYLYCFPAVQICSTTERPLSRR